MTATPVAAAGWYADPVGMAPLRWWDGSAWTAETRHPAPVIVVHPSRAEELAVRAEAMQRREVPSETLPSRRQVHARLEDAPVAPSVASAPAAPVFEPVVPDVAAPLFEPPAPVLYTGPTRSATVAVWLLAFTPYLTAVLYFGMLWAAIAMPDQYALPLAIGLIGLLLTVVLVVRDWKRLISLGHDRPASTAWVLLGVLAYLIARLVSTKRNTGKGAAPLVVFLVNSLVGGAMIAVIAAAAYTALERLV